MQVCIYTYQSSIRKEKIEMSKKSPNKKRKNAPKQQNLESNAAVIVAIVAVIVIIIGACIGAAISASKTRKEIEEAKKAEEKAAQDAAAAAIADYNPPEFNISHYVDIDIKDYGKITVGLDSTAAPETVENFVSLAESGFYDGLTFHRIMKGFMMQGGDPEGTGYGGSDKTIKGEFPNNGVENPLLHVRGAISMARSQDKDSASSQFFIVHQDAPSLDGDYAAFGYVTEGIGVVDAVCEAANPIDNNGTIPASQQPVINSVTVREAK